MRETIVLEVEEHTEPRQIAWYITWEELPDDWAILVLDAGGLGLSVIGRHRTEWVGGVPTTFPPPAHIERHTSFTFTDDKRGRALVFTSLEDAKKYIYKQVAK